MTARRPTRLAAIGVGLALTCVLVWWLAGLLAEWAGIGDLDLVVRVVAIFAYLTLAQAASERLVGAPSKGENA